MLPLRSTSKRTGSSFLEAPTAWLYSFTLRYRLMIHLLDHVARLQAGIGGAAGRVHLVHHHSFGRGRKLQFLRRIRREVLDGHALQTAVGVCIIDAGAFFFGGELAERHGNFLRLAVAQHLQRDGRVRVHHADLRP